MTAPEALPRLELPEEIGRIAGVLEDAGYETWCVGGALRDRLLGHRAVDVDLATAAPPEVVQRLFPKTVAVGVEFGTVGVLDRHRVLHEVTTFRRDVSTDGRRAVVAFGASLEEDLARRDFTLNALAYHPLRHEWRDPHGGAADLRDGLVRAVGDPALRFREDYLRILRMIRFAARFGFAIDPATWEAAVAHAEGLRGLSAERVREEWWKGLLTARSLRALCEAWHASGAAAIWLPELSRSYVLADENPVPRDPVLLSAALFSDPESVLRRLRASNADIARAAAVARGPERPGLDSDEGARRWLAAVGDAADDLLAVTELRNGRRASWREAVQGVRLRGEATHRGMLAVTGDDLQAAGVPGGPELGRLLDRLLDAVLTDPSRNTRDRLLALVRTWR